VILFEGPCTDNFLHERCSLQLECSNFEFWLAGIGIWGRIYFRSCAYFLSYRVC